MRKTYESQAILIFPPPCLHTQRLTWCSHWLTVSWKSLPFWLFRWLFLWMPKVLSALRVRSLTQASLKQSKTNKTKQWLSETVLCPSLLSLQLQSVDVCLNSQRWSLWARQVDGLHSTHSRAKKQRTSLILHPVIKFPKRNPTECHYGWADLTSQTGLVLTSWGVGRKCSLSIDEAVILLGSCTEKTICRKEIGAVP